MEDPRLALQPYLTGNEVLRWTGRPRQGFALYPRDLYLVPFSIFFAAFSVFWIWGASTGGLFALFGVPFVAIGAYALVGRFVVDA